MRPSREDWYIYALIFTALAILMVILITIQQRREECKWVAPLKTEYVLCDDNTVRSR